ncbi:hypothetical protein [Vallitalea guaymasensis]|uniref:hypothetical protein n=1 Tax=Vallitalea guaymasensis TaxID=1185412 RepID=UPI000DE2CEFB|nr:hypothetical protein [Vallitalea guaymasensis]
MKKVIFILFICIVMGVPVLASETIPNEELTNSLNTIISQNEESIQIQSKIAFYIDFILVIILISIAFFLAYKFIKKIAIKILNITTKGMSL